MSELNQLASKIYKEKEQYNVLLLRLGTFTLKVQNKGVN